MIKINKEKCIGCGACIEYFPKEIKMEDGKAYLIKKIKGTKEIIEICPMNAIMNEK